MKRKDIYDYYKLKKSSVFKKTTIFQRCKGYCLQNTIDVPGYSTNDR